MKLPGTMARLVASHITWGLLAEGMSLSLIDLHHTRLEAQQACYQAGCSYHLQHYRQLAEP